MPRIAYIEKKFQKATMGIIVYANQIIEDYAKQGLTLTLRQLYYRFVAADLIPNTQKSYSRLGSIINDARLAGYLDWNAIEDRGRNLITNPHWNNPADIVETFARQFAVDKWVGQKYRVEIWVEKQALEAVIGQAADEWDCPYFSCKGYTSQSEMWRAAQRFAQYRRNGQEPIIIHLGDHDPSGIDMTRDIDDRNNELFGVAVKVDRIALNMDQIEQYKPPPNFAKQTDSRFEAYAEQFGDESWELDALEPATLNKLIQDRIRKYVNIRKYNKRVKLEEEGRKQLQGVSDRWDGIIHELENDAIYNGEADGEEDDDE